MKSESKIAMGGGAKASKKLMAAMAVLAVAFVVLAAVPVALTDSDARTATPLSGVTVAEDNATVSTTAYINVKATITVADAMDTPGDIILYLGPSAKLTVKNAADTAEEGFTIYSATAADSDGKFSYYQDSQVVVHGNGTQNNTGVVLSIDSTAGPSGYKLAIGDSTTCASFEAVVGKPIITATYGTTTTTFLKVWTAGMTDDWTSAQKSFTMAAEAENVLSKVEMTIQDDDEANRDETERVFSVTYGTTNTVQLTAPFEADDAGTLTVDISSQAMQVTADQTLTNGIVKRTAGSFKIGGSEDNLTPVIRNGIYDGTTVGGSASVKMAQTTLHAELTVFKYTTLEADSTIVNYSDSKNAIILKKGLTTTDSTLVVESGSSAATDGQITSSKPWTGAEIIITKDRQSGSLGNIGLADANGSLTLEGNTVPTTISGSSVVIYNSVTIEDTTNNASEGASSNVLDLTSSIIAESAYVELKGHSKLEVNTKLDVLGTITGTGGIVAGTAWTGTDNLYTQNATKSNISVTGTQPTVVLNQVAYKELGSTDNTTAGIDLAAEQGFKEIRLYQNTGGAAIFTISGSYTFPEGVTIKQASYGSQDHKISISAGTVNAGIDVTIPASTTLVLNNSGVSTAAMTVGEYATLNLEGKIKGTSASAPAKITGNGTFNMASTGAVESDKVYVQTKYATGTVAEIQVVGNMDTVPYPLYQKVVIPAGQTATVRTLSNVSVFGQLQIDGTLVIEDEATLTLGMSESTAQAAIVTVGSEGSIVVKNGGVLHIQNADVTASGDVSVEGTLKMGAGTTLTVKSNMTQTSTGIIGMASNTAKIAVGTDAVLTLNGYLGMGSFTYVMIQNSGSVVIDNSSISARAVDPQGSVTVSLVADAASVDIQSYLVETVSAKITVNDLGLQLAKVDSKYYYAAKAASTNDSKIYVVSYNEITIGADKVDAKVSGSMVISEKLTSKVSSNKLKVSNVMEISGSVTNTSTIASGSVAPTQKIQAGLVSSASSTSVSSGVTTYSGLSFTANLSVPSGETLAIGQWVDVTNSGVLKVPGYLDMTATGVSALTNTSGSISVTGKIRINTSDISGGTVSAAKYISKEGESSVLFNNYTSLDQAVEGVLADSNKNTDKTVTICGVVDISKSMAVPSPVKVQFASSSYASNKLTVGSSDSTAVLTFEDGAKLTSSKNQVVVDGTLYFADKTDDSTTKTICDVTIKSDSAVDITYTNIYTALENASSGDVVEVTKADKDADGSTDYVKLTKSVAVGDGVTLKIGSSAAGLKLSNGVTLTVNGVLDTAKEITAEKAFAKTATLKSGEERSAIALNGTIKAGAGASVYAPSSGTSAALSTGAYISGAYYTLDSVQTISTLEIAEDNFAKIASTSMTVYGTVTAGDLSFAKTSSTTCSEIILAAGASSTSKNNMTVSSITLSGVKITVQQNTSLTGDIENASGSVTVSKISGASNALVIADVSGSLTLTGEAVASDESIFTVSSGTVYAGTTGTSGVAFLYDAGSDDNAMDVASGATLMGENVNDIDKIVVDGTFSVEKSKNATVVSMIVYGTVDVFEGSDTESKGTLTVSSELYIGADASDVSKTGAAAVFNGPITYGTSAFVVIAAGSSVDEDALKSFGKIKTEFYVQDSLWITVYKTEDSTKKISAFDNPTPKDAYFSGWVNSEGTYAKTTSGSDVHDYTVGYNGFDKVYASVATQIYQIIIKADQGIGDLYLNGNIMQKGTISSGGYQYYAYWATVDAGTYEVTCKLANGYSGTAVLKDSDGKTLSGNELTVSGNPYNQSLITENFQLTGIEKSGYVQPTEEKTDSGLTVTDYLLIVLVILVVVLAVIVALRLMRS